MVGRGDSAPSGIVHVVLACACFSLLDSVAKLVDFAVVLVVGVVVIVIVVIIIVVVCKERGGGRKGACVSFVLPPRRGMKGQESRHETYCCRQRRDM